MQQVRTVLLGLRQLSLLTPRHYRASGGLRGVETLVIFRSLREAGAAVEGGAVGLRTARNLLNALTLPGGPNQRPKAQRVSIQSLAEIAGDQRRAETILHVLEGDKVVRPSMAHGNLSAWQLDHDYLAAAVISEARLADRWSLALHEGKTRFDEATGNLRRQWATLLSVCTLLRVFWERARGRLTIGDAGTFLLLSAARPVVALFCLTLAGSFLFDWNQQRILKC